MKSSNSRAPFAMALLALAATVALPATASPDSAARQGEPREPRARAAATAHPPAVRPARNPFGFADWLLEILRGQQGTSRFGSETGTTTDPVLDPATDPAPPSVDSTCPPDRVHCPLG